MPLNAQACLTACIYGRTEPNSDLNKSAIKRSYLIAPDFFAFCATRFFGVTRFCQIAREDKTKPLQPISGKRCSTRKCAIYLFSRPLNRTRHLGLWQIITCRHVHRTDRQSDIWTKWKIDKVTDLQNSNLIKWQINKMTDWQINKMTDRQITRLINYQIDKITDQ
jgi:hypothetical protein